MNIYKGKKVSYYYACGPYSESCYARIIGIPTSDVTLDLRAIQNSRESCARASLWKIVVCLSYVRFRTQGHFFLAGSSAVL